MEANILSGPELTFEIDLTLGELILFMVEGHADKVLQIEAETGKKLLASEVLERSIKLAKWMQSIGLKTGDVITIISENRLEYMLPAFAAFYLGVTVAPLNPLYTEGEMTHGLNISKPKVAFISPNVKTHLNYLKLNHAFIEHVIVFGEIKSQGDFAFEEIFAQPDIRDMKTEEFKPLKVDQNETLATIMCSSGTSGLPKGVMITHQNITKFAWAMRQAFSPEDVPEFEQSVTLSVTPLFHAMGFMSLFLNTLGGVRVIILKKFDEELYFKCIEKYKVNVLVMPPVLVHLLNNSSIASKYDLSSVQNINSGSSPLAKEAEDVAAKKLGVPRVTQSYGMTETVLGVLFSPRDNSKPGSVGTLLPSVKCKVINEQGKALGPYQEGELCFKSPFITKGYINNEEATKSTIDTEGWLHTGDVGYYDDDQYFYIVDRLKELIKYKSFQVAPAELEGILNSHPSVVDSAVVGLPDNESGELPYAFVVIRPGANTTAKELITFVNERVSPQKHLRGGLKFVGEIPRTPTGKILRRLLKTMAVKNVSKL